MAKKQRLLISFEEASQLYDKEKKSINSLAKSKGVHPDLLRRDLIYLGFKTRSEKQKINAFKYQANINKTLEALALGIWLGEGAKKGSRAEVTNCDPLILKIWLSFLIKICNVDTSKLKLRISLHDSLLEKEAADYWREKLEMEIDCYFSIKKQFLIIFQNNQWELQLLASTVFFYLRKFSNERWN